MWSALAKMLLVSIGTRSPATDTSQANVKIGAYMRVMNRRLGLRGKLLAELVQTLRRSWGSVETRAIWLGRSRRRVPRNSRSEDRLCCRTASSAPLGHPAL